VAYLHSYSIFLFALFILASGITILQVSANPYVSLLGDAKTASSRLTMTQAFNSLGTTIAPFFGALLILNSAAEAMSSKVSAESVQIPYVLLAGMLLLLAAIFSKINLPKFDEEEQSKDKVLSKESGSAWQHRHLVLGAIGIFVYVGAEVSIGSFLVSFFNDPNIANLQESEAAKYIAYYWGGAMIGRFVGALVMQKIAAGKVLAFNAVCAILLILTAIFTSGTFAMWTILLVGLCNSIMFPAIFSLAIVGGAILPLFQGIAADTIGVQSSFIFPALCYFFIAYYGLYGSKKAITSE
jgi:FHS family L-fucose permease-like MFS transporter